MAFRSRIAFVLLLLGVSFASAPKGRAGDDSAAEVAAAELLVRHHYIEGLDREDASKLTDAGVAHLEAMLRDPAAVEWHGNVLIALGYRQHPGSFDAIAAYSRSQPTGEVSRAEFNARLSLPIALGFLGRTDDRALRSLLEALDERDPSPKGWSYRRIRGPALHALLQRTTISGLATSGRVEARNRLLDLRQRSSASRTLDDSPSEEMVRHIDDALSHLDRVRDSDAAQ